MIRLTKLYTVRLSGSGYAIITKFSGCRYNPLDLCYHSSYNGARSWINKSKYQF